jgi:hypothetical protein
MQFEVLSNVTDVEIIATGRRIRQVERLIELFGKGRWRKMKGRAFIRVASGLVRYAEIHWYEAQGIGRRNLKFKRYIG